MLYTKLCIPRIGGNIIPRKKLEEKLQQLSDYRLAYVAAPAGYGKTTGIVNYLINNKKKYAWISVDEEDNDPVRFWKYFISSVAQCTANESIARISLDAKQISSNMTVNLFLDALEVIKDEFIIVIDDFHLISGSVIHSNIEYFIKYMPTNISLIIISRKEPENALSVMCSRGAAISIGIHDISFNQEETAEFFLNKGIDLTKEEAKAINDYTEGWAAGLVAASFSISSRESINQIARDFYGNNRNINTILDSEVYRHWPENIRKFLVHTSFLDRLSGSICNAITGNTDSEELLRVLAESNSFVVALDSKEIWYRYHHLFQTFLLKLLEHEENEIKQKLYKNAGEWYIKNGQIRDGIIWLLKAKDYERALPFIMERWFEMTRDCEFVSWRQWIDQLPESVYENSNTTFTAYSWVLSMENQLDQAEIWTEKAKSCFQRIKNRISTEERDYLEAHVICAEINVAIYRMDVPRILNRIELLRSFKLEKKVVLGEMNWDEPNLLKTAYGLRGRLAEVEKCQSILNGLEQLIGNFSEYFAVAFAEFYYERNCLKELDSILISSLPTITEMNFPGIVVPCFIAQAKARMAKGDIPGAFETIEEARKLIGKENKNLWQYFLDVFSAKLYLMVDDLEKAIGLLNLERLGIYDTLSTTRESEYLVFSRYLMKVCRLEDSLIILKRLENFAEKEDRRSSQLEILCLIALCYQDKGDNEEAFSYLELALTIGEKDNYIRTFTDELKPMSQLLGEYLKGIRNSEDSQFWKYARKLFRATNEYIKIMDHALNNKRVGYESDFSASLLSDRELEILKLIVKNLSNDEIANELFISVSTVKQHNSRIYDKLGVKNRIEAVSRAIKLGLTE